MSRLTAGRRGPGTAVAGAAALVTLIAVVAGLPLALYWLGGDPLPPHIPAWHEVTTLLLHRDDTSAVFLGAVRDVSWVAWAAFTVAVATEAQAALRGRSAPRLRLAGLQNAAGWLVALAIIAFAGQPAAALASVPSAPPAAAADAGHGPAAASPATVRPAMTTSVTGTAGKTPSQVMSMGFYQMVTVQPGDCLWTIAQRLLGNGDLYPEIASLNLGHDMGNGEVFTDPSLIWPGWVLQVPAAPGSAQPSPPSPPAAGAPDQHAGHDSGDPAFSLPHPAASTAGPEPAAAGPAQASPDQGPGHTTAGAVPAAQATPASQAGQVPPLAVFGAGVLVGGAAVTLARMRRRQRQARRPGRRIPLPASAPVIAAEQRLRAAAQRFYPAAPEAGLAPAYSDLVPAEPEHGMAYSGLTLTEPGQGTAYPELTPTDPGASPYRPPAADAGPPPYDYLVPDGDLPPAAELPEYPEDEPPRLLPPVTALRAALSELGAGLVAAGQPIPDITAVRVRQSGMELLLAGPSAGPPPEPFTVPDPQHPVTWVLELPRRRPRAPLTTVQARDLLPGLVTAGLAADGGYLLVDLEHLGVTTVEGPADLADLVVATAAAELTTSQLAGWYDLILAGFPELGAVDGRATSCAGLDDALDLLASKAVTLRRRLGAASAAELRRRRIEEPGDEDWALTLLVSRSSPTPAQLGMLLDLAGEPGGIAALVAGGTEAPQGRRAPASLRVRADPALPGGIGGYIWPADLDVCPQPLSRDDYESLASLFATAADSGDVAADEPPYDGSSWPPAPGLAGLQEPPASQQPGGDEPGAPYDDVTGLADDLHQESAAPPGDDQPGLRIGVMGTFTINGAPAALQPAQGQLILALALNGRDGLSNAQLCYLLGADPDHPKPSDSLRQLIVRTRRQLGRAGNGREWIEHLGAGQYALHPQARFDWADFEDLSERGLTRRDRGCLRDALALIRGRPFTGCYHWWLDVAFTETVRAQIVDAAELLAELELGAGDASGSARAARTGLSADPAAEQLWRAVMRAEHAAGNLAGVREAWTRCLDAITDIAPDGEPHPDTTALYQQLTGAARVPSAWWSGLPGDT
jgi:DNA-binding SARP family transcriptional activator